MLTIFLLIYSVFGAIISAQENLEIAVEQGKLSGKYMQTNKGRTFGAFTGIPYARPPVGELRFKAPVPAEPWDDTFDATKLHPMCPQILTGVDILGDEDCLYLNVYTQLTKTENGSLLPVMIYIHGGSFSILSGGQENLGPGLLMDEGVVLVTINYRLGALGFLSTGDKIQPGNNGLKDQNLAIKWVKNNIAQFGGNPDEITLFGQSVGGICANLHLLSPMSKGLIRRVISQSGTALSPRALSPNDQGQRNSKKFAELFDCPISSTQEMVECLRKVDFREIVIQQSKFSPWKIDRLSGFRPVIEPNIEGAFIFEHPIDSYKAGRAEEVPFLTGLTTEDNPIYIPRVFVNPDLLEEFNSDFNNVAAMSLLYDETNSNFSEVGEKLKRFYFDGGEIMHGTKSELVKMFMDPLILLPEDAAVRVHRAYVKKPVYFYLYGYRASVSFCDNLGDPSFNYGVCHTDELFRMFNIGSFPNYKPTDSDQKVTEVILKLWTNFAKTGNPTPDTDSSLPKWNPVQSDKLEYYSIKNGDDIKMADSLYEDRVNFWRSLPINFRTYHIDKEI